MQQRTLTAKKIAEELKALTQWRYMPAGDCIACSFVFKDFALAFDFMRLVAEQAEILKHHPDWSNSYNKVDISLRTHRLDGLSALDFQLARAIDTIADRFIVAS